MSNSSYRGAVTTFPKTKRFRSSSHQWRRTRNSRLLQSMSSSGLPRGNYSRTPQSPKTNNNEESCTGPSSQNGDEKGTCSQRTHVDWSESDTVPGNDNENNLSIFETPNFEECLSSFEKLHESVRTDLGKEEVPELGKTVGENGNEVSGIPTSAFKVPWNGAHEVPLKSILLTESRYESCGPDSPSESTNTLPKNKSIRFSPETVFVERNLESQFWSKIEQDRQRRKVTRNQNEVPIRLQSNTRRGRLLLLALRKHNLMKLKNQGVTSLIEPAGSSSSCPDESTSRPKHNFLSSTALVLRKSFSNFFSCFSPKAKQFQEEPPRT